MILKWLRRIFGRKKDKSSDIDILLEKAEEEKKALMEIQKERNVKYLEGLSWSAFRSHHNGHSRRRDIQTLAGVQGWRLQGKG